MGELAAQTDIVVVDIEPSDSEIVAVLGKEDVPVAKSARIAAADDKYFAYLWNSLCGAVVEGEASDNLPEVCD